MDYDSDTVFVTNQEQMVELSSEAYKKYPTVINDIQDNSASSYDKNMLSYAKMDNRIQDAQICIGASSNVAQVALSHYYNNYMCNKEFEDIFIIGSVLAQCSIDSAKRTFEIGIKNQISRLTKSECLSTEDKKMIYPKFFYDITKRKQEQRQKRDNEEDEKIVCQELNCPMDILPDIIKSGCIDLRKHQKLKTSAYHHSTWFRYIMPPREKAQYKRMSESIETHYNVIKNLDDEQKEEKNDEFRDLVRKINSTTLRNDVMHVLIAYALFGNGSRIRNNLLATLYAADKDKFLNCFIATKKEQKVA